MKISVALCTFNGQSYLKEQINSILNQIHPVDEIIICDDCSNDKTIEIIKDFKVKFPNLIQLFENEQSLGTIKNFEKAISLTKGDLIFLSDQDDIWFCNKVSEMVTFFIENPKCKLLFTNGDLIDQNNVNLSSTLWEKWGFNTSNKLSWGKSKNAFKDLFYNRNYITGATVCFHSSLIINLIPIQCPYGYWHDAFLGLHAAAQNGLMFLDKSLINYRIHEKQQVGITKTLSKGIIEKSNLEAISYKIFHNKILTYYPEMKRLIFLSSFNNKYCLLVNAVKLKLSKIINLNSKNAVHN